MVTRRERGTPESSRVSIGRVASAIAFSRAESVPETIPGRLPMAGIHAQAHTHTQHIGAASRERPI